MLVAEAQATEHVRHQAADAKARAEAAAAAARAAEEAAAQAARLAAKAAAAKALAAAAALESSLVDEMASKVIEQVTMPAFVPAAQAAEMAALVEKQKATAEECDLLKAGLAEEVITPAMRRMKITFDDIKLGKKLGEGSFGVLYQRSFFFLMPCSLYTCLSRVGFIFAAGNSLPNILDRSASERDVYRRSVVALVSHLIS